MNDERLGKEIGAFYRETEVAPPDSQESAHEVAARLRHTPQANRRRWLPAWRFRASHSRGATPSTEHQPRNNPTTNGHAPTFIGRTQTMLSPVKAITAGALIFALGAAFLASQPMDRPGDGVPGAEQAADPAAPVRVSATHHGVRCVDYDSSEVDGRVVRVRGYTCTVSNEWSDPRLQGTETYIENYVDHVDGGLNIGRYVHNIATDDGTWRMRPQFRFESDGAGPQDFSGTWVLDGEGAYEGLSVVLAKEGNELDGYIIESDLLPPPPEDGSTR